MSVLSVSKANCKNCYRCVRYCPVKAIRIKDSQAETVNSLCVLCGICLSECPQQAKVVESSIEKVQKLIASGKKVIATMAPSFPVAFKSKDYKEMYEALKALGFHEVEETAKGADAISELYLKAYNERHERLMITSACPVIKNLIEKYYPELIENLVPIVSPMIAHGKMLKKKYGKDARIVFIGPCLAKKDEINDISVQGDVDEVITFDELNQWIKQENFNALKNRREIASEGLTCHSRMYPLPGGLLKSISVNSDVLSQDLVVVDGMHHCLNMLDQIREGKIKNQFIEMLACDGGCIAGPVSGSKESIFEKRRKVQEFIKTNLKKETSQNQIKTEVDINTLDFTRGFEIKKTQGHRPNEKDIQKILHSIGKTSKEKELDCGACGYPSCRKKAEAVYEGMAEPEMCIPYMRTKAESLSNIILDSTPNGIIVVDRHLNIQEINHMGEKILGESKEMIIGKPVSLFMDDTDFAKVIAYKTNVIDKRIRYQEHLIINETICYIEEHDLALGIFVDVTKECEQETKLEKVQEETLEKAQEVINRQMRVAQEIAGILGETTAESKVLLLKLMELVKDRGDQYEHND